MQSVKRQAAEVFVNGHQLSIQRACRILGLSRTAYYRVPTDAAARDAAVVAVLNEIVDQRPRWGFWKCYDRMRLDGPPQEPQARAPRLLRTAIESAAANQVPMRDPLPLDAPDVLNTVWSLDFVHDALYDGRRFGTLNVLDDGNREGLGIDVATSIPSRRAIRFMEQLVEEHGKPDALRLDNGTELTSHAFVDSAKDRGIALRFIEPGNPNQNAAKATKARWRKRLN